MIIKQLITNIELGQYDVIEEPWDYPFEEYLSASQDDIDRLMEALHKATVRSPQEKWIAKFLDFIYKPKLDDIENIFFNYICAEPDYSNYIVDSYYKLEDDLFLADSSVFESDDKFILSIYDGFERGSYKESKSIEENFSELLSNLQKDYEDTELFTNFIQQPYWQNRIPSPCEYIRYYYHHRRDKYVSAIIKFVRYYRKRYILANINLKIKGCDRPDGLSTDFLCIDFYKHSEKDSAGNLIGKGKVYSYPDNYDTLLAKDFPLKVKFLDRHKALLLENWDKKIPTPFCLQEKENMHPIPLKKNHIAALAFAMVAKHQYKYVTRTDFINDAINKYPEFNRYTIKELLTALNDLVQKNKSGDFTQVIKDQSSMTQYIYGCYCKTKRGKNSKTSNEMNKKSMEYFAKI